MKVVGFTGFAQSGKDTAAGFLVERGWKRLAFADILRQSLYELNPIVDTWVDGQATDRVQDIVDDIGWDRAKVEYPEIRQLLQRFGTEVGRQLYGESFWIERVTNQITKGPVNGKYVITDVRFPNELVAVRNLGGKVYKIQRPGNKPVNSHVSDDIDHLVVDGIIPNTDSLDHFRDLVYEAVGLN